MKKLKLKFVLLLLIVILPSLSLFAQDCGSKWKVQPFSGWEATSLTKIASCTTGKTYEFVVPFSDQYEYYLSFYASSSFNNRMNFTLEDASNGSEYLSVPGEMGIMDDGSENPKGSSALASYYDEKLKKDIHPFFIISPDNSVSLKIIIEIPDIDGEEGKVVNKLTSKGCVKVLIFEREKPTN